MSEYIQLIVAGLGGSGQKATAVNFTVVDGIRTWAWLPNELVSAHNIRAGVTLTVQEVRALGETQTHYEKDGEMIELVNPKQQLLLGGQMTIAQPKLEPLAKLEVVNA